MWLITAIFPTSSREGGIPSDHTVLITNQSRDFKHRNLLGKEREQIDNNKTASISPILHPVPFTNPKQIQQPVLYSHLSSHTARQRVFFPYHRPIPTTSSSTTTIPPLLTRHQSSALPYRRPAAHTPHHITADTPQQSILLPTLQQAFTQITHPNNNHTNSNKEQHNLSNHRLRAPHISFTRHNTTHHHSHHTTYILKRRRTATKTTTTATTTRISCCRTALS